MTQREEIDAKIRAMQGQMEELKGQISAETETQLRSSSTAARTRQRKATLNLSFQNEIEALEISIEHLRTAKGEIEQKIELLKGWG